MLKLFKIHVVCVWQNDHYMCIKIKKGHNSFCSHHYNFRDKWLPACMSAWWRDWPWELRSREPDSSGQWSLAWALQCRRHHPLASSPSLECLTGMPGQQMSQKHIKTFINLNKMSTTFFLTNNFIHSVMAFLLCQLSWWRPPQKTVTPLSIIQYFHFAPFLML